MPADPADPSGISVREATHGDVDALVSLRAEMFRAMGSDTGDAAAPWRTAAAEWFADHLDSERVFVAVVEADGQVVASAMGTIRPAAPTPAALDGRDILISNVCTLPQARRRGYARAAFEAVLAWARSTGIARLELMATGDGQQLYRGAGFAVTRFPAMRAQVRQDG